MKSISIIHWPKQFSYNPSQQKGPTFIGFRLEEPTKQKNKTNKKNFLSDCSKGLKKTRIWSSMNYQNGNPISVP